MEKDQWNTAELESVKVAEYLAQYTLLGQLRILVVIFESNKHILQIYLICILVAN